MKSDEYVVDFKRSKDYSVFTSTNLFVNTQNDLVYLDLFEEIIPFPNRFTFNPDGTTSKEYVPDLENIVHATVAIPYSQLHLFINRLTEVYNDITKTDNGGEEAGGD